MITEGNSTGVGCAFSPVCAGSRPVSPSRGDEAVFSERGRGPQIKRRPCSATGATSRRASALNRRRRRRDENDDDDDEMSASVNFSLVLSCVSIHRAPSRSERSVRTTATGAKAAAHLLPALRRSRFTSSPVPALHTRHTTNLRKMRDHLKSENELHRAWDVKLGLVGA